MYQIKVNGVLMPTIYYTLREAMDACAAEKARGCAVVTSFIRRAAMLKETSLSVARREPQEHLVVRASRKAELSVAAQFENWLLNNNYRPTTAFDYQGRIERLCRKEGYTLQ